MSAASKPLSLKALNKSRELVDEECLRIAVSHELLRERVISLEVAIDRHRRGFLDDQGLYALLDKAERIPEATVTCLSRL